MPISRSAKKALRSALRRKAFNLRRKDKVMSAVKSFKRLVATGDKKAAEALMPAVQKSLDKAAKAGTLKKNTAARKKSRLAKLLKKIS